MIKRKLKFENCENSFKATQLDNKTKNISRAKNKISIDGLKKIMKNS